MPKPLVDAVLDARLKATAVRFKSSRFKAFKTNRYREISIDLIVRDVGKNRILGKSFVSELSPTPMPNLAIIRLIAKIMSQNSKAAHLLRVSKTSATVFAKTDSIGSRPSMTEDGVAEEANQSTDTRE